MRDGGLANCNTEQSQMEEVAQWWGREGEVERTQDGARGNICREVGREEPTERRKENQARRDSQINGSRKAKEDENGRIGLR